MPDTDSPPLAIITGPRPDGYLELEGECIARGAHPDDSLGVELLCWLEPGHEGDHVDIMDGTWRYVAADA